MNFNYTCICYYCGEIYNANRSTSKYCCANHRSLYVVNGPQINNTILTKEGVYKDYYRFFRSLYVVSGNRDAWSQHYAEFEMIHKYHYDGHLPTGTELLLISSFIVRKRFMEPGFMAFISIKPVELLTKAEKASCRILKGGYYFADEEND